MLAGLQYALGYVNQAQHDWIERCIADNPTARVEWHERGERMLVDVKERRPTRERTCAVVLLGPDGTPEQIDRA